MNAIGRMLKVEPSTILYWVKNFALKTYEKPTPQGEVIIELDEMWHFLGSKRTESGSGRCTVELPKNLLIGNAQAEAQTLKKMLDRLQQLAVKIFFADNWEVYAEGFHRICLFRLRRRRMGWSGIIFGNGIGAAGLAVKPAWFQEIYV